MAILLNLVKISDMSVPQRLYAGEPTCLGSNADVRLVVADPDIAILEVGQPGNFLPMMLTR